jgi:hypothetical protein
MLNCESLHTKLKIWVQKSKCGCISPRDNSCYCQMNNQLPCSLNLRIDTHMHAQR